MHINYNKFNIISLILIILSIFLLVAIFGSSNNRIEFADTGLEKAVREAIDKEKGDIFNKDVQNLQVLDASGKNIKNLEGIGALIELRELDLEDNFVDSVSPLKETVKLQDLSLRNNEITNLEKIDFQDIIHLNLKRLSLRHNVKRDSKGKGTRLEDISLLNKMVFLEELELRDNHIKDLRPISNLRKLEDLDIRENKFTSIEPLETLTRLEKLNIRENKIESLESLRYLSRLTYLNIHSDDKLKSLDAIKNLVNLESLIMPNLEIEDINFLKKLTKLQRINAIDTNIEEFDRDIIEELLTKGALQEDVRPLSMINTLDKPSFSHDTGFYEEDFALKLSQENEDEEIYYTLDGSEPTRDSDLYSEAISIKEAGNTKARVVRAKVLREDNTRSKTVTRTYFIGKDINERFDMPIFSLVSDPRNLFDEEKGIYTDENAFNRGNDWERPVHVEYFEAEGDVKLRQDAGIRIHGNYSRILDNKSLRLYASSEYSGENKFENVFFEDLKKSNSDESIDSFKRVILRNSGNDNDRTMFADGFMQELAKPIGTFDTQSYQPSVIFINGEYYGIQNIRERLDENYLENHYDIDKNEIVILENDATLYKGSNSDVYHYKNMIKYIEENDIKEDEHLRYIETQMDFDNFIDYFATEIYFGNSDWPDNNIKFWRKTTDKYIEGAPYGHDGRWRWMMVDTDQGYYYSDEEWGHYNQPRNHKHNTIKTVMGEYDESYRYMTWPNYLFRELMTNVEFKNLFLSRFNDLTNSYLKEEVAIEKIDEKVKMIENEIPYQIKKWGKIESEEAWQEEVNKKKKFARERSEIIRGYIMEEFKIEDTISVKVANESEGGYVRLNRLDINKDLPGNENNSMWEGIYFKDLAISVEAIAKEGYTFSHWQGVESSEPYVEINPRNNIQIKAVFIKDL